MNQAHHQKKGSNSSSSNEDTQNKELVYSPDNEYNEQQLSYQREGNDEEENFRASNADRSNLYGEDDLNMNGAEKTPANHKKQHANHQKTDSRFKTPQSELEYGPTLMSVPGISPSPNKKTNKKKTNGKNFIARNKNIKTRNQMFSEYSEKKKERISAVNMTRTQNSFIYSPERRSTSRDNSHSRLHEWKTVTIRNDIMSRERPAQGGTKNLSKDYVVKHMEVSLQDLLKKGIPGNNLGGSFSRNRKEKAYHMTNSSSITNLNSYKSLDMSDRKEVKEFPTTKGNQQLKQAMNQSQVFERTNPFLKDIAMPEDFVQHRSKSKVVHNVNNPQVQNLRLRNISSQIF